MSEEAKSTGQSVIESMLGPVKRGAQTIGLIKPDAPAPKPSAEANSYAASEHAKAVAAANASFKSSAAGQAHGQTARRERLIRKYATKK